MQFWSKIESHSNKQNKFRKKFESDSQNHLKAKHLYAKHRICTKSNEKRGQTMIV